MAEERNKPYTAANLSGDKTVSQPQHAGSDSFNVNIPSIALPKGGGAIKEIDEKFSVNAVNGSASFSIGLPFSAARGVTPSINLSYSSGAGNSIFGLGWQLGISSIKRKTDKKLPQYFDAIDSDTFMFSEAEDLVPQFRKNIQGQFVTDANGDYIIHEQDSPDGLFTIRFYQPRIEGLFARIERWTAKTRHEIRWRITTKENVITLFGWTTNARLVNPVDETKIYEWLPEFVFDDKGNCAHYLYKKENDSGLILSAHNTNRVKNNALTYANIYLEKIYYGNKTPYWNFGDSFPAIEDYLFSTVFDFGEYNPVSPFDKIKDWDFRPDAFSDYKAGFEIRTTRLCKRVLLFHHFTGQNEYDGLVKSVDFDYATNVEEDFTFLKAFHQQGYIKKEDGSYSGKKLPPVEFFYQAHDWNSDVKNIASDDLIHAPIGLDESNYQFTDLYNEGLQGILTEQANGWYYKQNLGEGKFENAKLVSPKPSFIGLGSAMQLTDLDADGGKQLVSYGKDMPGYFELSDDDIWQGFRAFNSVANVDLKDANTRMLDLDGDGKPEIVITGENVFTWYPSEGRNGFSQVITSTKDFDEEKGPNVVFADATQSIFLADMSGDGLTDIVRIRNGEVCYWPNLGFGKFGAKVMMDNSPMFDLSSAFNPLYVHLADIDGSGTTDIIYLGKNKFTCWKNLSGNRFGIAPYEIGSFPEIHSEAKIAVTDLLGNGVACIVWSSPLSKDANAPLKYIDLMNSKKPHIMISYRNNMGKEVQMEYTPSTKFYIEDKLAGKPWVTKLHFPVHCVSKTITEDKISGYQFVSQYNYHHGYYDHHEREFRGFGMVEQVDAETFEHWKKGNASNVVEESLHQEPVVSRTWHHTGAFLRNDTILNQFKEGYWYNEMNRQGFPVLHQEADLPDAYLTIVPGMDMGLINKLSAQEWREAYRSCKGMGLRAEIFAKDAIKSGNTDEAIKKELTPFSVATHNCIIELLQPKGNNQHAVFIVKESEAITYNYERNPEDPRISHKLNTKLDEYANVLESVAIVYPRRVTDSSLPVETIQEQTKTVIIYSEVHYTNDVISENAYRLRLLSETKTYELRGVSKAGDYYKLIDFENIAQDSKSDTALYHELDKPILPGKAQKRLIEHFRSIYLSNNLNAALPLHQLESMAFQYESYKLAYTPELIQDIFDGRVNDALLAEGRFTHSEGDNNWWIRSGTTQYVTPSETTVAAQNRFYVPVSYTNPYGAVTKVSYYGNYFLFVEKTEDALGNKSGVDIFNFRTLSPKRMRDINNNLSEVICDELGMVKAMAVMGKGSEADDLTGFDEITTDAELVTIQEIFDAPDSQQVTTKAKLLLQRASARFVYDLDAYSNHSKPAVVASIIREEHFQKNNDSPVQISFEYTNGMGEVILKKMQCEPGIAKQVIVQQDDTITINEIDTASVSPGQLRWIGNGRSVKNNKGNAVKQYEPYFSVTHRYEDYKELVETGVTPIMYYDSSGRLIKTEMPDGSFSKIEFNSWKYTAYDAIDNILESRWYLERTNRLIDAKLIAEGKDPAKEKQAADKSAMNANTPSVMHVDTLGRPVLTIEHNRNAGVGTDEFYNNKVKLDTEGNIRTVTDARDNIVMEYKYDMLGNKVYLKSMDSGRRWALSNILGSPLRKWDERNHEFQFFYDILQRPAQSKILGGDGTIQLNNIFEKLVYGESLLMPGRSNETILQNRNILGQLVRHFDTGGVIETPDFDFNGNPLTNTRKLFKKYKEVPDWTDVNLADDIEQQAFVFASDTDALGRITRQTAPDGSIIIPSFSERGLLNKEEVIDPGTGIQDVYIKGIEYNEKGLRDKIIYGNDVTTKFYYDKETFRLKRLESKRQNNDPLQDWYYTFDPAGNITHIEDKNIPASFFNNQKIQGVAEYTYDALYRLIEATGRENDAALLFDKEDNWNDAPFRHQHDPGDPMAMRNYVQQYKYDNVGNIVQMRHQSPGNNWARDYTYSTNNNRLVSTQLGDQIYSYTHHAQNGFITGMPHLQGMSWNFKEELVVTIRQSRTDGGIPETTWYQYDGDGQRIRKITENQAAQGSTPSKKDERIYISGYELYKKYTGSDAGLERTSLGLLDKGNLFVMIESRNEIDDGTEKKLVRYQLQNHTGSAALELDAIAQVISYEEYHPFGTTSYEAKNTAIKSAAKRYRFIGMERDEETGMEYHGARYYLSWLGRWLSGDPAGISDSLNVYAYSKNNPIRWGDKNGKQSQEFKEKSVWDDINEGVTAFTDAVTNSNPVTFMASQTGKFAAALVTGNIHPSDLHVDDLAPGQAPLLAALASSGKAGQSVAEAENDVRQENYGKAVVHTLRAVAAAGETVNHVALAFAPALDKPSVPAPTLGEVAAETTAQKAAVPKPVAPKPAAPKAPAPAPAETPSVPTLEEVAAETTAKKTAPAEPAPETATTAKKTAAVPKPVTPKYTAKEQALALKEVGPTPNQTINVLTTAEGKQIVTTGGVPLSKAQLALARKRKLIIGEFYEGHDAEPMGLAEAGERGLMPTEGYTTNKMCSHCQSLVPETANQGGYDLVLSADERAYKFQKSTPNK